MGQMLTMVIWFVWWFAVLIFLWRIWHNGHRQTVELQQALLSIAYKTATSAHTAAEAALALAQEHSPLVTPPEVIITDTTTDNTTTGTTQTLSISTSSSTTTTHSQAGDLETEETEEAEEDVITHAVHLE